MAEAVLDIKQWNNKLGIRFPQRLLVKVFEVSQPLTNTTSQPITANNLCIICSACLA